MNCVAVLWVGCQLHEQAHGCCQHHVHQIVPVHSDRVVLRYMHVSVRLCSCAQGTHS
jgi:hypothetical protein